MKLKRFTKPLWLRSVGREALGQVFSRFAAELEQRGKVLPAPRLDDHAWYAELAFMVMAPENLPEELVETLFLIEAMATTEAQDRLLAAAKDAGLSLDVDDSATPADVAVQVWLAGPELLVQKHNEARLSRLSAFDYFGSRHPAAHPADFRPSGAMLATMTAELDAWFRAHHRGRGSTHIDVCPIDEELLFVVQHGDTYRRTVKVDHGQLEVLHFRPAKDDMVIYAPQRDELRIHAGTKGEREAYRRAFGVGLHGYAHHFDLPQAYTLEPLRTQGRETLNRSQVSGIEATALTELEVSWEVSFPLTQIHKARCVLLAAHARGETLLPEKTRPVRAVFSFRFRGSPKVGRVEIRPPNTLRLGVNCDALLIHRWLCEQGIRTNLQPS